MLRHNSAILVVLSKIQYHKELREKCRSFRAFHETFKRLHKPLIYKRASNRYVRNGADTTGLHPHPFQNINMGTIFQLDS